jgi:PilZ domain
MRGDLHKRVAENGRMSPRIHTVDKISVNYEGRTEEVADRLPDVSPRGMFIGTSQRFPEGAVLNLKFRLAISGAEIRTRCEVRYCQPGVGVGVEFIGISPEDIHAIEREVELCAKERAKHTAKKKAIRAR